MMAEHFYTDGARERLRSRKKLHSLIQRPKSSSHQCCSDNAAVGEDGPCCSLVSPSMPMVCIDAGTTVAARSFIFDNNLVFRLSTLKEIFEMERVRKLSCHLVAGGEKSPVVVCVTGAAGNIAYSIVFHIAAGRMLGPNTPIELRLLDIPPMAEKIEGVKMELDDCAFPLLSKIVCTTDYQTAFSGCQVALLIGAKPRGPGMVRADLLKDNAKIFAGQGQAIEKFASKDIKVLVVGNPANTNALITSANAPSIPKENITALTRLDQNRALAQLSIKLKVPVSAIQNAIIWGNHSKTLYADVSHGTVRMPNGQQLPIRQAVKDDAWLQGEFLETVQLRGAAIIAARKLSSAASAGNAAVDHVRSWLLGTGKGEIVSMAVASDGSYGVPKGIIYSFPVTCQNGNYSIVQGLNIDAFSRDKMKITADELLDERKQALGK